MFENPGEPRPHLPLAADAHGHIHYIVFKMCGEIGIYLAKRFFAFNFQSNVIS